MDNELAERQKTWQPKPRPDWVQKINDEGKGMDTRSIVPLNEN